MLSVCRTSPHDTLLWLKADSTQPKHTMLNPSAAAAVLLNPMLFPMLNPVAANPKLGTAPVVILEHSQLECLPA
jgi:hypothetical protein